MLALRRQTNPNWQAYLYLIDQRPLEYKLRQLISLFNDARLFYVPLNANQRPAVRHILVEYD